MSTLYNCTLTGNVEYGTGGGGADNSVLYNCVLTGNSAYRLGGGGGAWGCSLYNCTVTGNSVFGYPGEPTAGGGTAGCKAFNCIVYSNSAMAGENYYNSESDFPMLNYCCTFPLPTNGVGNFTNEPAFVDYAGGNLRLQTNSPCINAGNNACATNLTDLDGNPRITGGTVDVGAYEFQSPSSLLSYAWAQQHGLPTDGSADIAHSDSDGLNNWQEWIAGTDPTNTLSTLRIVSVYNSAACAAIQWTSVTNRTYWLESTTNVATPVYSLVATNLTGQAGTTTCADTNAPGTPTRFYRVGVKR